MRAGAKHTIEACTTAYGAIRSPPGKACTLSTGAYCEHHLKLREGRGRQAFELAHNGRSRRKDRGITNVHAVGLGNTRRAITQAVSVPQALGSDRHAVAVSLNQTSMYSLSMQACRCLSMRNVSVAVFRIVTGNMLRHMVLVAARGLRSSQPLHGACGAVAEAASCCRTSQATRAQTGLLHAQLRASRGNPRRGAGTVSTRTYMATRAFTTRCAGQGVWAMASRTSAGCATRRAFSISPKKRLARAQAREAAKQGQGEYVLPVTRVCCTVR